jgi:hypothetical protein
MDGIGWVTTSSVGAPCHRGERHIAADVIADPGVQLSRDHRPGGPEDPQPTQIVVGAG